MTAPDQADLDAVLALDEQWNAAYHHRRPQDLAELLHDDWLGFFPDGTVVTKAGMLQGMAQAPEATLIFERHASRVYGDTAITRGTLYVGGQRIQGFLRVYARQQGQWKVVSVQVVP